jgi:hypothetical protein
VEEDCCKGGFKKELNGIGFYWRNGLDLWVIQRSLDLCSGMWRREMRDVIWCVMEFVSLVGSRSVGLSVWGICI